jgi:hypothetical protein
MLETRGWISLILGVISVALGVLLILYKVGVVAFNVNDFMSGGLAVGLYALLIIGGVFLLLDSAHEMQMQTISIIIGIILIVIGGLSIIGQFGLIGFNLGDYLASEIVRSILLIASGVFLLFGSGD